LTAGSGGSSDPEEGAGAGDAAGDGGDVAVGDADRADSPEDERARIGARSM
jgi:hypothetical protein